MNDILKNVFINNEGRLTASIIRDGKLTIISYPKYIMEQHLGRRLKKNEEVHHKDRNPFNNDISNLQILTRKKHSELHAKEMKLNLKDEEMICPECGKSFIWTVEKQRYYRRNHNRKKRKTKYFQESAGPFCSRTCSGKYGARIQNKNKEFDTIYFNVKTVEKKPEQPKSTLIFNSKSIWKHGYMTL